MSKGKMLMRAVKRAGLTFLALEGLQAAAIAGATRWAGTRLRDRSRNRALRMTGHALTTAAALVPAARVLRRRFA
jgi:20S proteasome alpha/beta subunit